MFKRVAVSELPPEPFAAFVAVILRLVGIVARSIDLFTSELVEFEVYPSRSHSVIAMNPTKL